MRLFAVGFRMHCEACGERVAVDGADCAERARLWSRAHYLPVVDQVDVASSGGGVGTWRRRVTA